MLRLGSVLRLAARLRLGSGLPLGSGLRLCAATVAAIAWGFASTALAQAPAEDALKRIIEEGNPAYVDWTAASSDRDQIGKLYEGNGYRLLWSDGRKPTPQAISLLQQLRLAGERGLDPEDYPGNRLAYLLIDLIDAPRAGIEQWALFDAGLSLAGIRFLSDVHLGRIDPSTMGHDLSIGRVKLDIPATLAHLAGAMDVAVAVDALEPQFSHYALLKRQLSHYRALASEDGLSDLPALPAKSLKPGDDYSGAGKLQRLLVALGDAMPPPPDAPAAQSLSPELVDALKHFQGRHGEKADGVLGAATFTQLTRPLSQRVQQIELTMERWRWLPSELVTAPIIVNIPQFRLFAFESTSDSEAHIRQMDVIVGKSFDSTQTPVFAADMSYLIFRPYWEVPYNIALKEIVPTARNNPADIERRQMEIVRGNGDSATVMPNTAENVELVAKGTLRLRQRPGPNNSLGLVKFMFPNPYNVYLHSTPAQSLFAETRRDFSHGCIRVSDPVGLAQYALRDAPEWTREKILAAMDGDKPLTVTLKNRIRVFIVYGTAIATEKGNVLFFDDIYRHDERLEKALEAKRVRS
ncbi:MAG TPA: L,D-transpeptidase family protein [Steroidobacteraceae bacterium]